MSRFGSVVPSSCSNLRLPGLQVCALGICAVVQQPVTLQSLGWRLRSSNLTALSQARQHTVQGPTGISVSCYSTVVSNTTSYLRNLHNDAEIFLVGTAHVSRASAEEVREVIRAVKPGTVMVELCDQRMQRLMAGGEVFSMDDFVKGLSRFGTPGFDFKQFVMKSALSGMYQYVKKFAGLDPGLEFKVAIEEARRLNARVVCGDQSANETLRRLAEAFQLSDLWKSIMSGGGPALDLPPDVSNLEELVESLKNRAAARKMTQHMRDISPAMAAALIDERDQIMVDVLKRQSGRVVGVVGLAHLDGMERRWEAAMSGRSIPTVPLPESNARAIHL